MPTYQTAPKKKAPTLKAPAAQTASDVEKEKSATPAPTPAPDNPPAKEKSNPFAAVEKEPVTAELVTVETVHPYRLFIPTQKITLSPKTPTEVIKDRWVANQIAKGTLRKL